MTRAMKEILIRDEVCDYGGACHIANKAGFFVECYDGDGENGMCAPVLTYSRRAVDKEDSE